ncbi:response regulator transcription factor [Micrococcales bacterium 31B]|nr:response regulator transcription factor [Micrococcales bacterium 31B]
MENRIRAAIVDDDALVRAGLSMIVGSDPEIDIVAEADDGVHAVPMIQAHFPDVVLMDVRMPQMDGLRALKSVMAMPKPPRVIMLTTFDLDEYVIEALQNGADGFLLKDTPPLALVAAVKEVARGGATLSPGVTKRMIDHLAAAATANSNRPGVDFSNLTEREMAVLGEVGQGYSNAEIGSHLYMSEATVKAHVSKLLSKLGCSNRVQIALIAHDAGITEA